MFFKEIAFLRSSGQLVQQQQHKTLLLQCARACMAQEMTQCTHTTYIDYIIVTADYNLHTLNAALANADLNSQKPLGYKSVKPRHLRDVWASEYARAITN